MKCSLPVHAFSLCLLLVPSKGFAAPPAGKTAESSKAASPAAPEAKPGSELRKAILEALRKPVQKACDESAKEAPELKGKKVIFTPETVTVSGDWAYVSTTFTPDFAEGMVSAVLRKTKERWEVKDLSWADDLPDYTAWAKRVGAPRTLFPADIPEK